MKKILKVIGLVINWIFGVFLTLFGVYCVSTPNSTIPGLMLIIWGFILLPPAVKLIERKLKIIITKEKKGVIFLVTSCIFIVSASRISKNLIVVNTDNYNITEQNSNSQQTLKEPEKEDNKQKSFQANNKIQKSQNTTPKPKISQKPNKKPTKNKIDNTTENTSQQPPTYKVSKVVDGETIEVAENGTIKTIRLIGMRTPECYDKEASNKAKKILSSKSVFLETDDTQGNDEYGRLLAYVFLEDGANFNKLMIQEGYAYEYNYYDYSYKYQEEFKQAQKQAVNEDKGFWKKSICKDARICILPGSQGCE